MAWVRTLIFSSCTLFMGMVSAGHGLPVAGLDGEASSPEPDALQELQEDQDAQARAFRESIGCARASTKEW